MGNTAHGAAGAIPESDVEIGETARTPFDERSDLSANLQGPDEAFARIGLAAPAVRAEPDPGEGEKKKKGFGSTLKRLLSGKSKRKQTPPLPRTIQDDKRPSQGSAEAIHPDVSRGKADESNRPGSTEPPKTNFAADSSLTVGPKKTAWGKPRQESDPPLSAKSPEALQMAKYLGIDVKDESFLWIAAEALNAELPDGWEEHKTDEGDVYYFDTTTKESSWEHPLDGYYRFLYRKMRKISREKVKGLFKSRVSDSSDAQRAKDRELVDLLWGMELDRRRTQVLEAGSESSSFLESGSSGTASSNHSQGSTGSSNSRDSSRSRPPHAPALPSTDPAALPTEVRDIAAYLGIDLAALSAPITPDEVREMSGYLGIDVAREGYLLPLAKMALLAPLPRGWEIYKDDAGEPFYYHKASRKTSYRHPADEYFIARVLEERARHVRAVQDGSAVRVSEPWVELSDAAGERYWHNFRTGARATEPPPTLVALDQPDGPPAAARAARTPPPEDPLRRRPELGAADGVGAAWE